MILLEEKIKGKTSKETRKKIAIVKNFFCCQIFIFAFSGPLRLSPSTN
jgi:hypothetical protein